MGVLTIYKWIVSIFPKSSKLSKTKPPKHEAIVEVSRNIINDKSEQEQAQIIEAVESDTPESDLADLLNGLTFRQGED